MPKKTRKKPSKPARPHAKRPRSKTVVLQTTARSGKARTQPAAKSARTATIGHKAAAPTVVKAKAVTTASKAKPPKPERTRSSSEPPRRTSALSSAAEAPDAAHVKNILEGEILSIGANLPTFKLPRDGGEVVALAPVRGRSLVVFFYPRAGTPGCTKEAMDFSRLAKDFDAAQTDIVGVSADPLRVQEAFRDKHDLRIPLLSDQTHSVLEAFGVWGEKAMYGKILHGILRTTVLIGADGRIINIWRRVKVDGHADVVLACVKAL